METLGDAAGIDGDILVTSRTDPGWVPLFPSCSGLLIERGSLLSHSAVVARELGLPTIYPLAPCVSVSSQGQALPERASVASILKMQLLSKDHGRRAGEMWACIYELMQAGYSKAEVTNSYDKILALWALGPKAMIKEPAKHKWVEDKIAQDLNKAIAEFYPTSAPPAKQRPTDVEQATKAAPQGEYECCFSSVEGLRAWKADGKPTFACKADFDVWAQRKNLSNS